MNPSSGRQQDAEADTRMGAECPGSRSRAFRWPGRLIPVPGPSSPCRCLASLVRRALLTCWHRRCGPARDSMPHQLRIRGMPAPGTRLRDMCYGRLPLRPREVPRLSGCFRVGDRLSGCFRGGDRRSGRRGRTGAEASHRECGSREDAKLSPDLSHDPSSHCPAAPPAGGRESCHRPAR